MDLKLFELILIFLINLIGIILGIWVLKSNARSSQNKWFCFMTVLILLWVNFAFLGFSTEIKEKAEFFFRLNYSVVALFLATFFYFFTRFFIKKSNKILFYAQTTVSVFFAIISIATGFVVSSVTMAEKGPEINYGLLGDFFSIYAFLVTLIILAFLYKNYIKISGTEKTRVLYFFIGIVLYASSNIIFNAIFPLFYKTISFSRFGDYSVIFFLIFTAYAIIKHRLMDIKMVVARSVAFMIMMVSIVGFAAGFMMYLPNVLFGADANNQYSLFLRAGFGLIMVFGFQPFRRFITKITDKIFFKNDYELHELIKKITNNIYSTLILIELLYKTIDILIREMKASRGMFVLLDEDGKIHTTQSIGYGQTPEVSAKEVTAFAKHGILLFDDLTEGSHFKTIFRRVNASIAVGFINEGKPVGALFLGEKNSGDMYNTKDIKLFEVLAPEMVVAIQRAEEHEKVQNFNVYLQSEVARKTKELQEANEHLLELDKAKDEFISMASHQLRTPLTAIKGYLSMLLEGDAGEVKMSQYDFINEAFSAGNRMVALINDLLNVSRMDTGRFFLEPVTVDIEKVVQEEMKQLSNSARDKKLYLKLENKAKALPKITVDETKIRQVVMNFIDNAIYYTMKGGVTVILDKDDKNVIFRVEDTGIGVPEKAKEELFTKFFRAENARTARPDGTGLGIYLARKVIEDHGGGVIFESTEGKGSVFGFKLPIKSKIKKEITVPPPDLAAAAK